jgi:hypothetical protein
MRIAIFFCLLWVSSLSYSQSPNFEWAKKWSTYTAFDIATDDQGNVYTLSSGSTQVNFNPSGTAMGPTAGCGAITKFDSNGNVIWVKFITRTGGTGGSCEPKRLFIKGNYLYYAGEFGDGGGNYDFNFSNTANYNVGGGCNGCGIQVFVSKIDLDGNFQWFTAFGQYATVNDIYVDNADNVFLAGGFRNGISLNSQSVLSNGDRDAYLMKLNPSGLCQWVKSIGSNNAYSADEKVVSVKVNSLGEIIFVGNFEGTVDIDPGPNTTTISSLGVYEAFVLKLSTSGNLIDYRIIGGTGTQRIEGLEIAQNDDIILTGVFSNSTDFNLGSGVDNLYHNIEATFIARYSNQFDLNWVKQVNGANVRTMNLDPMGLIYLSGVFVGTVDFDPSATVQELTSGVSANTFILKLNMSGGYSWSGILQGGNTSPNYNSQFNEPENIFVKSDVIYLSGNFQAVVDFNPGLGIFNMSSMTSPNGYSQNATAFILKLSQCPATSSNLTLTSCAQYTAPDGQIFTQSGQYTSTLTNASGCDSIVSINLTITQPTTSTITVSSCGSYISPSGAVFTSSGIYADTIGNSNGCDSIISINLTVNNPTFSNTSITSCGSYTSPSGNVWSTSGIYSDTLQNATGCDSIISINLTINTVDTTVTKSGFTLIANQASASYQWYNCTTNTPINGATSQSYTATSPGWYSVLVTANECSEMSECKQIKKLNSNVNFGMNDLFEVTENRFLVYPNPFTNNINISTQSAESFEICITDIRGRVVYKAVNTTEIPLEFLEAGMYQLTILYNETIEFHQIVKL